VSDNVCNVSNVNMQLTTELSHYRASSSSKCQLVGTWKDSNVAWKRLYI